MTEQLSTPNIPTLTNYNWVMWRILIEGYMKQHDLYSFISSKEVIPVEAAELKSFKTRRMKASGILQQYMDDPRAMWLKLEGHYQSNAIANQAKVYNDFLACKFKGEDIDQFITDMTSHISNLNASILDKIPLSLVHTREVLIQNLPLTIDRVNNLLENRRRDDSTIKVKTEESAMKVLSVPSKSSQMKCSNGQHNHGASHLESQCFELFPEQKARMEKRRAKTKAKANKTAAANESDVVSVAWHSVKQAQSVKLPLNTAYLDSGASHHMIANQEFFTTYSKQKKCKIELADGKSTVSPGMGIVVVKTESGQHINLECLHVPSLVGNLISEGRLF
ncbi:hypothetical protein VP01_2948g1 [Puccinia sorghi]|uniref:Retrovirus-related Pol polyprotein from transposon TNT 1-94-like beta-barrel domain-containing protein n=1 Tax=Puccinia sorghi TaxID=27349 RepID=A0A0L6V0Z9_9BASI|nr:hypothetical protein VP01_2949g1 [Puccinia sorghi]KNZ54437.1 hypothetical protein VP01_2948g1 [Puccinia sorghi]